MRNLFAAHVPPDNAFFESLWKNAIVVLDTNVVLNLYRFSDSTRDEVLAVLRQLQDRLWLPNQVAWEFFRRRAAAMTDNERDVLNALNKAKKAVEDSHAGLRGRLADTHHLDEIVEAIDAKVVEVETARNTRLEHYSSAEEPILREILDLFDGRVAPAPDEGWLGNRYKEGRQRYDAGTPPGYKDAADKKAKADRVLYGDYLLWKEVLEHAKKHKAAVMLVTNDQKEDWVEEECGRKLGPRREMLDEFMRVTGRSCWIYNVRPFLEHAKTYIAASASEETMREVEVLAVNPTIEVGAIKAHVPRVDIDALVPRISHEFIRRFFGLDVLAPRLDAVVAKEVVNALAGVPRLDPEALESLGRSAGPASAALRALAAHQAMLEDVHASDLAASVIKEAAATRQEQERIAGLVQSEAWGVRASEPGDRDHGLDDGEDDNDGSEEEG